MNIRLVKFLIFAATFAFPMLAQSTSRTSIGHRLAEEFGLELPRDGQSDEVFQVIEGKGCSVELRIKYSSGWPYTSAAVVDFFSLKGFKNGKQQLSVQPFTIEEAIMVGENSEALEIQIFSYAFCSGGIGFGGGACRNYEIEISIDDNKIKFSKNLLSFIALPSTWTKNFSCSL